LVEQISASFKEANKDPLPLITQSIEIQANETLNLIYEQVKILGLLSTPLKSGLMKYQ
jgi:hypothetical protein